MNEEIITPQVILLEIEDLKEGKVPDGWEPIPTSEKSYFKIYDGYMFVFEENQDKDKEDVLFCLPTDKLADIKIKVVEE